MPIASPSNPPKVRDLDRDAGNRRQGLSAPLRCEPPFGPPGRWGGLCVGEQYRRTFGRRKPLLTGVRRRYSTSRYLRRSCRRCGGRDLIAVAAGRKTSRRRRNSSRRGMTIRAVDLRHGSAIDSKSRASDAALILHVPGHQALSRHDHHVAYDRRLARRHIERASIL